MSAPTPNAHGVYDTADRLVLPMPRVNWRGMPMAEISLIELPDGWRMATAVCLLTGSGHSSPLTADGTPYATRADALAAACDRIRDRTRGDRNSAQAVLLWLDRVANPAQRSLFG